VKKYQSHFYEFGPYRLDIAEKLLFRGNERVPLTLKAIETLCVLIQNRGHLVEKAPLIEEVWPNTFVQEGTLAQNIFILRRTLGKSPDGSGYIETLPKRGYRFVAEVREVFEENADDSRETARAMSQSAASDANRSD